MTYRKAPLILLWSNYSFGASINIIIIITKSDKNPEVVRGQSIESILKSVKLTIKYIINYQKRDD